MCVCVCVCVRAYAAECVFTLCRCVYTSMVIDFVSAVIHVKAYPEFIYL